MKVSVYYERREDGSYQRPLDTCLSFYWGILGLTTLVLYFLVNMQIFSDLKKYFYFFAIFLLVYTLILMVFLGYQVYFYKSPFKAYDAWTLSEKMKAKIVEARDLTGFRSLKRIRVPWVVITFPDGRIKIEVAKIPGVKETDIDSLQETFDSCLTGKYRNFAITIKMVSDDRLSFIFFAEDVGEDFTWIPQKISDLKQEPYLVKLQQGLTVDLTKSPGGIGIWGSTGVGKSTVAFAIVAQLISNVKEKKGSTIIFLDGKSEYKVLSSFYPSQFFCEDSDEIERVLKAVVEKELPYRQKIQERQAFKSKKIGLSAKEAGLGPLIILADEVGNCITNRKQRKQIGQYLTTILQRGRSLGCFVIWVTQDPSVSGSMAVLEQGAISQLSTKILLGSAKPEVQREVFGTSISKTNLDVPAFRGYYTSLSSKGKPGDIRRYFVPNLYKNNLSQLSTFEKLYLTSGNLSNAKLIERFKE